MTFRADRRRKSAQQTARAHPIGWMLRRAAAQAGSVFGPATLWLYQLNTIAPADARARDDWPQTPEQLAHIFGELSEGLRALGVVVTRSRMMICGRVHRVWRVESVFNHNLNPRPRGVILGDWAVEPPLNPR